MLKSEIEREQKGEVMSKMRVVQVTQSNGPFELVEREIPEPGPGQVRIKVEAWMTGFALAMNILTEARLRILQAN